MNPQFVRVTGFLNSNTIESSLGRLGQAALPSGASEGAVRALVTLTCWAHGIAVAGLRPEIDEAHLNELASIGLVYRSGENEVKLV